MIIDTARFRYYDLTIEQMAVLARAMAITKYQEELLKKKAKELLKQDE